MNTLPMLLGGGILAFIFLGKKKSSESEPIISKTGSKENGYEIINCNKIIIYNKNLAMEFAYQIGFADYPIGLVDGNCIATIKKDFVEGRITKEKYNVKFKKFYLSKKIVNFIFNLYLNYFKGKIAKNMISVESATEFLNNFKEEMQNSDFDVSDLKIEL